jgi:hypothetical protein
MDRASPSPRIICPAGMVRFLDKRFNAWISFALSASQIALWRMAHVVQRVTFSTYDTKISSLPDLHSIQGWRQANLTYIKEAIKPHP